MSKLNKFLSTCLKRSTIQVFARVVAVFLIWFIFIALITLLPIAVQFNIGGLQRYLLGLYHDLGSWDIFVVSVVGGIAVWSLMITQAIMMDGIALRFSQPNDVFNIRSKGHPPKSVNELVPKWLDRLFNFPLTWWQVFIYFLLALPGLIFVISNSNASWWMAIAASIGGILLAFVIMFVLTLPAFAGKTTTDLSRLFQVTEHFTNNKAVRWIGDCLLALRRVISWFFRQINHVLDMNYILEDVEDESQQPLLASSHFLALCTAVILSLLYFGSIVLMLWIEPHERIVLPALAYLLILITLLIWLLQGMEYHLSIFRLPTFLILLVGIVGAQIFRGSDYYFEVATSEKPLVEQLTPIQVASTSGKNLVIVTSTGGGILAAGWTTLALEKLITKRPELAQEIRVISAASGGSVGTAFYVNELRNRAFSGQSCTPTPEVLKEIHEKSVRSSLADAAYGFSFIDFWTILFGGPVWATTDRGKLLENRWAFNSTKSVEHKPLLGDLVEDIRSGCIPAPILNTTVMENGRRVMLTPMQFPANHIKGGVTLADYLFSHASSKESFNYARRLDISLWTAARLSATFPYISPAVRADLKQTELATSTLPFLGHHFIDGGYYDNYGVASAIDWLDVVMTERYSSNTSLKFDRVLILQLRVSPTGDSRYAKPAKGHMAAFAGPLLGLFQIREGAAYSRNESELDRLIRAWRNRPNLNVQIDTVIIEPKFGTELPLSWHLTQEQIFFLSDKDSWHKALDECIDEVQQFLNGEAAAITPKCREGRY